MATNLEEQHARMRAFIEFWQALDKERGTHVGFGEAWVEYRAVLIEREAQERALAHAAFGDREERN